MLGIVPKTYLPNYREFYEKRHFTSGAGIYGRQIRVAGHQAPFGTDLLFRSTGSVDVTFHVELCEDFWAPLPPSTAAAMAGAELLINLSASNITIGKADTRRLLCASQSARAIAAYAYSAAGPGESTTDLAWDGHAAIFEHGELLAETERFANSSTIVTADVDLGRIRQERMRFNTFGDCAHEESRRRAEFRIVSFELDAPDEPVALQRAIERFPFVPSDPAKLREHCYEAYNIQVQGLATRLQASRIERAVIGVSGGLNSTQALIVAARAMDRLGSSSQQRPRLHLARLCDVRSDETQCLGVDAGAWCYRWRNRHPARGATDADGSQASICAWRADLRRHLRERPGRTAHGLSVSAGEPEPWPGGRHRRPFRAGARVVHLRGRRSDVALQCQRLGGEDADSTPHPFRGRFRRGERARRHAFCTRF